MRRYVCQRNVPSALAVISLPPGSKNNSEYERMLVYLGQRDAELLEGRVSGYHAGQECTECGKGKLQFSGRKERIRIDRESPLLEQENLIEVFECNSCGKSFSNYQINLK
jgi:hypothetical protein